MIYRETIELQSKHGLPTFHDITVEVRGIVARSKKTEGLVSVYSRHTTCCVITQEEAFDMSMTGLETLQQDFIAALGRVAPDQRVEGIYLHPGPQAIEFAAQHGEDLRGCHNTDAHLRSALVGRSETLPIIAGTVDLGDFGRIYFVDLDQTRGRVRTVQVTVMGE